MAQQDFENQLVQLKYSIVRLAAKKYLPGLTKLPDPQSLRGKSIKAAWFELSRSYSSMEVNQEPISTPVTMVGQNTAQSVEPGPTESGPADVGYLREEKGAKKKASIGLRQAFDTINRKVITFLRGFIGGQ
jgi:hypothetical protein